MIKVDKPAMLKTPWNSVECMWMQNAVNAFNDIGNSGSRNKNYVGKKKLETAVTDYLDI